MAEEIVIASPPGFMEVNERLFRVQSLLHILGKYAEHVLGDDHLHIGNVCRCALDEIESALAGVGAIEVQCRNSTPQKSDVDRMPGGVQ